jgi:lipid-A-disaccharide synthase-like uncharacterized protein
MNGLLTLATALEERGSWWPDSWYGRFWVVFGFGAQAVFAGRFLVQWIASERRGKSYIPLVFWYLSIVGALMLFSYAVLWKRDLVGAVGQSTGSFVYVRNLMLLRREREQARGAQERGTTQ